MMSSSEIKKDVLNVISNIYVKAYVQQQTTHTTQRFHLLIFQYLPKIMVLAVTMKTERKMLNLLNFVTFREL